MASKEPPKEEVKAEEPPKKAGSGKLIIILLIVLVLLLLAGMGILTLLLLKSKKGGESAAEPPKAEASSSASTAAASAPHQPPPVVIDPGKPPVFVALDPIVVNLAPGEGERYLQVAIVLRIADQKFDAMLKQFMPEIQHRINLLLSSKLPSELATPKGREHLAMDIRDTVNEVMGYPPRPRDQQPLGPSGPVQAVLFRSFIIQ
ncbi:MAG: flagellar basal body-associated FliL family protein [Hydrogenophilus sp.]|nr:flagellar basal body-associated FliL family protein [Hydrogenophilus sp.]